MEPVTHVRRKRMQVARLLICLLSSFAAYSQTVDSPVEYQVKAAFLLNFTKFIDWPPASFANPDSPITICILGKDPFGPVLDEIVQGEKVNDRKVTVQRISQPAGPQTCQVVFVSTPEKDMPKTLGSLGRGVLTVGEGDRFLRDGGMVALVLDNRRVRFDINQTAAAGAGLSLSARLLNVAREVEK
jgi:YfiR/HmsC-like